MTAAELRHAVRERARRRCEYCQFPEGVLGALAFHLEHIRPRQHGGQTMLDNLAWACMNCNAHKGPNLSGIDAVTDQIAPLFSPRRDAWLDHFEWQGLEIVGLTAVGRATVAVLDFNAEDQIEVREILRLAGRFPFT